ncbi:MAG: hypothetical protein QF662_06390, partial [Phycisphaerae bacterium]|nr:hypothetical protein [Phycisphaerae bacterium]
AGKHSHDKWHTGLKGYDVWVKALGDAPAIRKNAAAGHGQAYSAQCWAECRQQAVAFLEEARKRLNVEKVTPLFDEAIKHYKVVSTNLNAVAKLFPFEFVPPKAMDERVNDTSRCQKAVKALKAAKEAEEAGLKALAGIAKSLEAKGVKVPTGGKSERESGKGAGAMAHKKMLANVQKAFGEVSGSSPLVQRAEAAILCVLLKANGVAGADYETVMATSGWSGQFAYEPKASSWVAFAPPGPTVKKACEAAGVRHKPFEPKSQEESFKFIKESIDAGQGVMADFYETAVVCGYEDAAEAKERKIYWLCSPFAQAGQWVTWKELDEKWWKGPFSKTLIRIDGKTEPKDGKRVAMETMRELVRLATTEYSKVAGAVTGFEAIEKYAADVADISKTMSDSGEKNKATCYFDRGWGCYAVYPQWTARKCTATYLKRAAKEFPEAAGGHMVAAAKEYDAAHAAWQEWEKHIGRNLDPKVSLEEGNLAFDKAWASKEHREAGAAAVRKALEHEKTGVGEIKKALDLLK